ncbi:MAG: HAMP domain-containing histidine kinase [Gemmatimonadota bacterium]|nr:HAMP domain-containing histidine kinase [Gemmatimonadota bacterium]
MAPEQYEDLLAGLLEREHSRAERRLNTVRFSVLLVLGIAAACYSPRLTLALDLVNLAILLPMLAWTLAQHVLVHRHKRIAPWLATANPIVDITAVTVLLVGYGLVGLPDLAVKSPIFLAYFGILAARPLTGSTRRAGWAAAVAVVEYASLVALFLGFGLLRLNLSPMDTLSNSGTSLLDEGAKALLLGVAGAIATYATSWHERVMRRAIAAQVERSAEEHALAIRLQEADKLAALGALSATLAHEVNNPLAAILATAELLRRSPMPESQRDDVDAIIAEARRTTSVVRELLRAARPNGSAHEELSLETVVGNVLGVVRPLARSRRVHVEVSIPAELPRVHGQGGRLEQVILNLIVNAMQAIEERAEEGTVVVSARDGGAHLVIFVDDTGPGFAPGVAAHVFDRFFTTKPSGKGTGLGLWIVKQIVDEHGGSITADNRAGGGARMTVRLPIDGQRGVPAQVVESIGSSIVPRLGIALLR